MLVLSRKLGERVYIGDDICVTVVGVDRGQVRIGIEAPPEVLVFRQEVVVANPHLLRVPADARKAVGSG